ncbi:DUF1566 domain-containing protein [Candidatus Electronema sp. JC]|uniref:Lcl C-terminal domain-containing protein n=1 Tax=Candidatus Electronema sp. JC TaxID=3401570 RepID=UPI003AA8D06D
MQKRFLFFSIVFFFAAIPSWAAQTCRTASITATTSHLVSKAKTDGTVADSKTRVMWKRCPEGFNYISSNNTCSKAGAIEYSWTNALALPVNANSSKFSGYENWRLPNVKELQSIVEEQCYDPAVNLTVFPDVTAAGLKNIWSNSPSAVGTGSSWYIDFYYGDMLIASRSADMRGVRLVRDCTGTECD